VIERKNNRDFMLQLALKNLFSLIKIEFDSDTRGMRGYNWGLVLKRERDEPRSHLAFS